MRFTGVRRLGSVGVPLSMGRTWFFPLVLVLLIDPKIIRIIIFIIPINGPTIGENKLHTLIIVIGGNYIYIYIYI